MVILNSISIDYSDSDAESLKNSIDEDWADPIDSNSDDISSDEELVKSPPTRPNTTQHSRAASTEKTKSMHPSSSYKAKESVFEGCPQPMETGDRVLPSLGMAPSNMFPSPDAMESYFQHMLGNMHMQQSAQQFPNASHPTLWSFPQSQFPSRVGQGEPSTQPREDGHQNEYGFAKFSNKTDNPSSTNTNPFPPSASENVPNPPVPMTESQKRKERRKEAKHLISNVMLRKSQGLPPYVVETGIEGLVSGNSKGKSRFIKELRTLMERELLVGEHRWRKQPDGALAKIAAKLAITFEYKGAPLCLDGLATRIKTILRNDRNKWRKFWCEHGKGVAVNPPEGINLGEWKKLVKYWISEEAKEKSQFMKEVRGRVENPSRYGSGGKVGHDAKISIGECPQKQDLGIGEQTPPHSVNENAPLQIFEEVMVVLRSMELRLSTLETMIVGLQGGVDVVIAGLHALENKGQSSHNVQREVSDGIQPNVEKDTSEVFVQKKGVKRKLGISLNKSDITTKSVTGEQGDIQIDDVLMPRPKTRNQIRAPLEGEQDCTKFKRPIKKAAKYTDVDVIDQNDHLKESVTVGNGSQNETNVSHQAAPIAKRTSPRKTKELTKKDFASGDIVTMFAPTNRSCEVAVGIVQEGPGNIFHGKQIPATALKLTVIAMLPGVDPGMEIPYPDMNDDPPQDTLESLVTNLCLWPINCLRKEVNNARSQQYRSR